MIGATAQYSPSWSPTEGQRVPATSDVAHRVLTSSLTASAKFHAANVSLERVGNGSVCKMGSCRLFSSVASSVADRARQRVPVNQSIAYPLASTVVSRNTLRLKCIGITRDFTRVHSPAQCCEVSWINAGCVEVPRGLDADAVESRS